jgi:hypothetical protein
MGPHSQPANQSNRQGQCSHKRWEQGSANRARCVQCKSGMGLARGGPGARCPASALQPQPQPSQGRSRGPHSSFMPAKHHALASAAAPTQATGRSCGAHQLCRLLPVVPAGEVAPHPGPEQRQLLQRVVRREVGVVRLGARLAVIAVAAPPLRRQAGQSALGARGEGRCVCLHVSIKRVGVTKLAK